MRMKLVTPLPPFTATCLACGRELYSGGEAMYADLDGPAFKAYYCGPDTVKLTKGFSQGMDANWQDAVAR